MDVLVLGGTAWLGRTTARVALARGHRVTCLARGEAGAVADGARLVAGDRSRPGAYDEVCGQDWDAVVEVSWQPGFVRGALTALGPRAAHWTYVSSGSVFADVDVIGADESAPLLPALDRDSADRDVYGEAKVACEVACQEQVGDRLLIARAGLIGGPGDGSDRAGYWVGRAARAPREPMLVPQEQDGPTQIVDIRDLAAWFLDCVEQGRTGTFNAVGPVQPFAEWLSLSRELGGHTGPTVEVPGAWLIEQGVEEFMGPDSMALWFAGPPSWGFSSRDASAAAGAGLRHRPLRELLTAALADERRLGLDRPRRAGLSPEREQALLEFLTTG